MNPKMTLAPLVCIVALVQSADAFRSQTDTSFNASKGMAVVGKEKCSAKSKSSWNGQHSCSRSWRNSDGGRCNWIEDSCVPNCADARNHNEELCESSFCVWSAEHSTCTFASEKLAVREEFCKQQTKLSRTKREFCTGLSLSPSAPLYAMEQAIKVDNFMGCWYVHANIPTFVDKSSVNNIEYYSWDAEKNRIKVAFQYEKPAGKKKLTYQRAYIKNNFNTEWAVQPKVGIYLPLNAPYIIIYCAKDYSSAIIGYPDRSYLWIMTRSRKVDPVELEQLIQKAVDLGYDRNRILKVPFDEGAESPDCKP